MRRGAEHATIFGFVCERPQRQCATLTPATPLETAPRVAPAAPRTRVAVAVLTLVAVGALGVRPAHAGPAPLPSAAGEIPSATRGDVVRALRKVRHKYGEDAVVIESQLLINAMRSGAQRATAVSVEGVTRDRGKRYLVFIVETGLVFDSQTRGERVRIRMLWATIVAPTLERLAGLQVPADGIKVVLRYHHRPYRSQYDLRASIDRPGTPEETAFYVLTPDVAALATRDVTAPNLIARARVTVDGQERTVEVSGDDPPSTSGPD